MSDAPFVFEIGPLPISGGAQNAYFVTPRGNGSGVYLANDHREGLAAIVREYDPKSLECDPQLAEAASEFGIRKGDLTPQRSHWIGGAAFKMSLGDHFQSVQRESAISGFASAASSFWQAAPWQFVSLHRPIVVALSGAIEDRLIAVVFGSGQHSLSLYQDMNTVRAVELLARSGRIEDAAGFDSLMTTFEGEPGFAANAMQRAYGLPRIPVPIKVKNGEHPPLGDFDLLALGAALKAASFLNGQSLAAESEIVADDLQVRAILRVMAEGERR